MMFFRLALLLSVESFVLIASIFLLVYIAKQQVSKWFTYGTSAITICILMMMICTIFSAMMMRHHYPRGMENECGLEQNCPPGMMPGMMHGMMMRHGGLPPMMHEGNFRNEMKECEEGEEGEDMPCCKKGMDDEKCMKKEVIITKHDSMPKKEIIIKRK